MTENASHVVVHHHFDNTFGEKLISMTCCIVLSVAIVLILLIIILAIIIYLVFRRKKQNIPTDASVIPPTGQEHRTSSNANKVDLPNIRRGISNPAASFDDNEIDINFNRQRMPMSTYRVNSGDRQADSSDSSAGLCEVLFPQQHQGEIIRDPPPNVVAYAGKIYSTTRRPNSPQPSEISRRYSQPNSPRSSETFKRCPRPNSQQPSDTSRCTRSKSPLPSGSGTRRDTNMSMEWDYHESRHYEPSNDSVTDQRDTVNICWV